MLSRKNKAELLTCGYTKENHNAIPMEINKLIEMFYDKYFYWTFQKDEMKQFLAAKNGETIHFPSTITFRGIELDCVLRPNGLEEDSIGMVEIYVRVKNIPTNIAYFITSTEVGCESFSQTTKWADRSWKNSQGNGVPIAKLSDCQHMTQIDFHWMVDVLSIKYKDWTPDYKTELTFDQHVKYKWKIDKSQMEMIKNYNNDGLGIYGDNFDNDNWCSIIYPKGCVEQFDDIIVGVILLKWPLGISAIHGTYSITLNCASGKVYGSKSEEFRLVWIEWDPDEEDSDDAFDGKMYWYGCDGVQDQLLKEEWIEMKVDIEITNIYVDDKVIDKDDWIHYGFAV